MFPASARHEFTIICNHIYLLGDTEGNGFRAYGVGTHHFPKYNFGLLNVTLTVYFLPHFGCQCDVESKFCDEFAPGLRPVSIGGTCLPIIGDESTAIQ